MTASLRILSSKADSNTCESFTRSGLKLESVHQESPRSDVFRKRATKPLLNQRQRQKHLTWAVEKKNWTVAQWSKVLFSDESKFCISFGNQGPRVWRKSGEAQNPCCLKSSVKFPQSVMIWAAMSSAGVGPLCFLKSTVNAAIYQEILEHFMLPSADKLYGDADLIPRVWRKSGEAQNPCCLKSSVKFPQSVMIWAAMSSAGVGLLCFLKSTVNAAIYQEILEHFMLPSADKLYGDADFIF